MASGGGRIDSLWRPNLAPQSYGLTLAGAYRAPWIYDSADRATIEDIQTWDKIRDDATFAAAIENRRRAVASRQYQMIPHSDRPEDQLVATAMQEYLGEARGMWRGIYHLTEAIFRGSAWTLMTGKRRQWAPTGAAVDTWWMLDTLHPVDRWRIRIVRGEDGEGGEIRTHWEVFSIAREAWERLTHPEWFVRHYYERSEADKGYGRGILRSLYNYYYAKAVVLTQELEFIERFARGLAVMKLKDNRAGGIGKDNDDATAAGLDQLDRMVARHGIVLGHEDEIDVIWPGGSSQTVFDSAKKYLDSQILRLIQASDLTTGQGDSGQGSYAQSKTHKSEKADYFAADRAILGEDLDATMVEPLYKRNLGPLTRLCQAKGLPLGRCPSMDLDPIQEDGEGQENPVVQEVGAMLTSGADLVKRQVYERTGWDQPTPADYASGSVLKGQTPAPPGGAPGQPGAAPMPGQPEKPEAGGLELRAKPRRTRKKKAT